MIMRAADIDFDPPTVMPVLPFNRRCKQEQATRTQDDPP